MKWNLNFIIGASAASLMAFSSLAQEAPNTKSGGTEITQEHSTNDLQLDVSKEVMSKALHFKPNAWPNFGDPSYVAGVYRTYLVEPYFTADLTTEVGPTVRNAPSRTSDARGLARP